MSEENAPYPVRVDAALDAPVSRWLWLVKWLLLVPHAIVLVFLWIAFVVVSVIAFFAILVTGRYPRTLFDFNVGVLRWSWRVHYYGYGALGTDRYPPFTLADVPDYPARLHVPYPERLSRGLVLVKWWLLVLPHYVVVAVFAGGGLWVGTRSGDGDGWDDGWAFGGLISLLVFVAGVVLLFAGRYPRSVYDFVLGMDRWVLRVTAYAALMTDQYPPFRLDMGGTDPGSQPLTPPPGPAGPGQSAVGPAPVDGPVSASGPGAGSSVAGSSGPAASAYAHGSSGPVTRSRWTGGRIVALVVGAVLALASTGLLLSGGALLWADQSQREDGWLTSPSVEASTARYALVSDDITLDTDGADWVIDDVLGRVRLEATARGDEAVFVGVAPSAAVAGELDGVGRSVVDDLSSRQDGWVWDWFGDDDRTGRAVSSDRPGGPPATAPGELDIWTASAEGTGTQTLEWTPADGDWTVVVMPTDRSAGLTVDLAVAGTVPGLGWLAWGLLAGGAVLLAGGVLLIVLAVHRAQVRPAPPVVGGPAVVGGPPAPRDPEAGGPQAPRAPEVAGPPAPRAPEAAGPPVAGAPPVAGGPPVAAGPPAPRAPEPDPTGTGQTPSGQPRLSSSGGPQ